MKTPVLYVFAISHYCEKARWALDYLNIDYRLQHLSPISYMKFVRSLGAADTTLPVLTVGSLTLQGSSQIIDWAETHCQPGSKSGQESAQKTEIPVLAANTDADISRSREIEQRLDDLAGVHIRRYYYSEALLNQPQQIRRIERRFAARDSRQPCCGRFQAAACGHRSETSGRAPRDRDSKAVAKGASRRYVSRSNAGRPQRLVCCP